jgi:DNA-binding transcriptional MerR regulator
MAVNFDDGKDADALRTIGEVCAGLGIKAHVLRYWEQQFPMLKPLKRSGGRRYYRPEDVAMVERIDQLVNTEGYTLKGAKAALKQGARAGAGAQHPDHQVVETGETKPHLVIGAPSASAKSAGAASRDIADLLPQLKTLRGRLANALAA